jgi:hypothetical protein
MSWNQPGKWRHICTILHLGTRFVPGKREPSIPTGGWVNLRAGLDVVEKSEYSIACRYTDWAISTPVCYCSKPWQVLQVSLFLFSVEQKRRSWCVLTVLPKYSRKRSLVHSAWVGMEKQARKRTSERARRNWSWTVTRNEGLVYIFQHKKPIFLSVNFY